MVLMKIIKKDREQAPNNYSGADVKVPCLPEDRRPASVLGTPRTSSG